ncbi:UDP-N-acetylmuramate--L-alanine ligase [Portibacter marinus]|uniref:UDP-N-acetylmuramate--L-alanine ligase n=1 Tax=Portibacter marinus TaxID=2898660 RepID=UPI001EFEFD30|nr:Mur ligase family protein [Portibacter marinus]
MRVHIISIGGRIMHSLALLLKADGHEVSGSDDEIYEPSRSKLKLAGLLPDKIGWDRARISDEVDFVLLGMHAKKDNPELQHALELGLEVLSYPEFIYRMSKEKQRIVVAGSHGKTTTVAMIMHVLNYRDFDFDYLIGAELDGFDEMIRLSNAPLIVIEGDEYLSSCIDSRPKMIHYQPDLSVITGIAWDHINVFESEKEYDDLFENFIQSHSRQSKIFSYKDDFKLEKLANQFSEVRNIKFYEALPKLENGNISYDNKQYRIKVFGHHNRANMMAALKVCQELGITSADFFAAISTFRGASKRMELLIEGNDSIVYRDFAHAPSKVSATLQALKEHYKSKKLIAILELHTYSSLNHKFLPKYKNTMDDAHEAYVYYSEHTLKVKNLKPLTKNEVENAFAHEGLQVLNNKEEFSAVLTELELSNSVVVLMSSGNFDKINVKGILIQQL